MIPGLSIIAASPIGATVAEAPLQVAVATITDPSKMLFRLTIQADGYADVVLPMSSFSMRLRQSPKRCYLNVQIPKILSYINDISDRISGEIRIDLIEGATEVELLTANISDFRYDQGTTQRSGSITAYKQVTWAPYALTVPNVLYKRVSGGVTTFRASPLHILTPTCEATVNSVVYVVTSVTWTVNVIGRTMEFSDG